MQVLLEHHHQLFQKKCHFDTSKVYFIIVRSRFGTTQDDIGFAHKKAQTISFVERGFEKLGLGHRMVISRGIHIKLNRVRSRSLSPGGGLGGSRSWPFFPASSPNYSLPLLY